MSGGGGIRGVWAGGPFPPPGLGGLGKEKKKRRGRPGGQGGLGPPPPGAPQHGLAATAGGTKGGYWRYSHSLLTPVGSVDLKVFFNLDLEVFFSAHSTYSA